MSSVEAGKHVTTGQGHTVPHFLVARLLVHIPNLFPSAVWAYTLSKCCPYLATSLSLFRGTVVERVLVVTDVISN